MTEKLAAEAAVHESEEWFHQVVENIRQVFWIVDPGQTKMLYVSPAYEEVWGCTCQSLYERPLSFLDSTHPDDQKWVRAAQAEKTKGGYDIEYRIIRPDGAIRWIRSRAAPVYNNQGEVYRIVGISDDITDHKQAEAELQTQRDFALQVMNTMGQGLTVTNAAQQFEYVNPAYARLFGYEPESLIGRSPRELTLAEDQAILSDAHARRLRGETSSYETRLKRADGSQAHVLITGSPRWQSGQIVGSIAVITDLTEQKQTEAQLHFQKALLESQSEAAIDGILVVSPDRQWISFNQRFVEMWQLPGHVVKSRSSQMAIEWVLDQVMDPQQFLARILYFYEYPEELGFDDILLKDGRIFHRYSAPVKSQDGILYGRVWFYRDVTDARRAEAELQAQKQRFENLYSQLHTLIESSRDGIALVGIHGRIRVINHTALELLGASGNEETWSGRHVWEMVTFLEEYAPAAASIIQAEIGRFQQGDDSSTEGEMNISSHILQWFNLPVQADDTPLGRLFVLRDVTKERQVEQMREDLINTLVHDLRNPLAVVLGLLDLLDIDETITPPQRQSILTANQAGRRMLNLVNTILDVSKLESGQMALEQEFVVLIDLVLETIQLQIPLANHNKIQLAYDIPDEIPLLYVDRALTQRILQNLVDNAVKFSPTSGMVRITAEMESPPSSRLRVTVSNSGAEISADVRGRLFQKFASGKGKGRGTGLGLVYCRLAVEAHGGRIWVESEPGEEVRFIFTLPVAQI